MLDTETMIEAAFPVGTGVHSVGDYDLGREIGRGGMSVVYEARDRRTGQEVALKLLTLPPTLTAADADSLVARFEREARTMARLSHPNIIAIHEIGAAQGQNFLAMEYLHGQTLRERLGRSKLTFREAFTVLTQIAGAVDAVHAAGIVHRDIKPLNVMLLPDGTAKLLDFGIARSDEEATITNANAVIGTPSYMAPEQVRGEAAAFATDLWSLGVLGYEMFAGHQPFAGQIVANVLYQVMNKAPAPAPHLPKAMQKVLRRALDKDPARRYESAGEFVQAIRAALPKSVPKPALPEPERVSKPKRLPLKLPVLKLPALKFSAPSVPAVPWWAQGMALLLLFGFGFGYAFQHRHQAKSLNFHSALAKPPVLSAVQASSSPADLPEPVPVPIMMLPAVRNTPVGTAQSDASSPQPHPSVAVPPVQPPAVEAEKGTEPKHPAATSGEPREASESQNLKRQNAASATVVQDSFPSATEERTAPEQGALPAQGTGQAQSTEQAQGAGQAQSAVQAALPVGGGAYDPEAEARLRKSEWSQSDAGTAP